MNPKIRQKIFEEKAAKFANLKVGDTIYYCGDIHEHHGFDESYCYNCDDTDMLIHVVTVKEIINDNTHSKLIIKGEYPYHYDYDLHSAQQSWKIKEDIENKINHHLLQVQCDAIANYDKIFLDYRAALEQQIMAIKNKITQKQQELNDVYKILNEAQSKLDQSLA